MPAGDNFMWFPPNSRFTIEGETRDDFFRSKKAFEVIRFRSGVAVSDRSAVSEGKTVAPVQFETFTIKKAMDSASPMLYEVMCSHSTKQPRDQARIPSAILALRKPGGQFVLYLQFVFKEVLITQIEWDGGRGQEAPTETVTFSFKTMGVQYRSQTAKGGYAGRISWNWDVRTNAEGSVTYENG